MISDVVSWAIQSNNLDDVAVKLLAAVGADFTKLLMLDFCSGIIKSIVLELNLNFLHSN